MTSAILWSTQFSASILTLAMPPFFALWIPAAFPGTPPWIAALAFAAPLASGAVMAPYWGRAADRFGRLPLTIRAHLGLSLALLLASLATHAWQFLAAMTLQGALGGTYASGRALLIERTAAEKRTRALTVFESAPRMALLIGPIAASLAPGGLLQPGVLRAMAVLPLVCALLLLTLRKTSVPASSRPAAPRSLAPARLISPANRFALLALFSCGGILAPYALDWTSKQIPGIPTPMATLLILLPNLVFAASALPSLFPRSWAVHFAHRLTPASGLLLQACFMAASIFCTHSLTLAFARLGYSIVFLLNWQSLHERVMGELPQSAIGRGTAELDALQRWSALGGAGLAAAITLLAPSSGPFLPLTAGVVTLGLTLISTSLRTEKGPLHGQLAPLTHS